MIKDNRLPAFAIALSIVALVISLYVVFTTMAASDENEFNAKVEAGIEAYVKKQQAAAQAAQAAPAEPTEPVDVSLDDDAVKGDADAPVTIVEFSDFQCPFCKRYVDQTYSVIKSKYIDTGKVKYVFRDYPLSFHDNARNAAIAAECVGEEGGDDAYFQYHDVLFANNEALDVDSLKSYASDMGYDIASCLDNEDFGAEVDADMQEGLSYGVRGTPAFFINGNFISGAQPTAVFESAIEAELAK
ncbi:DsbA family protein [Candidatus Peregrinibacteria bacterium]|nr:DsbA family protein [Candidatus Peregrinibacteria bacterium]